MKSPYTTDVNVGMNKLDCLNKSDDVKLVKKEWNIALQEEYVQSEHQLNYSTYRGFIETTFHPIRDRENKVEGVAAFVKDLNERWGFEEKLKA